MSRRNTLYASATNQPRQNLIARKDEITLLSVDWNALEHDRGTTLSSAAWSTEASNVVTLSAPTTGGGVSSALAEMDASGHAMVKNTATFADGTTAIAWWDIRIKDES